MPNQSDTQLDYNQIQRTKNFASTLFFAKPEQRNMLIELLNREILEWSRIEKKPGVEVVLK